MLRRWVLTTACVALAAMAVGSTIAEAKKGAQLKGRTSQGRHIRFAAHGNKLDLKNVTVKLRCHNGTVLIDKESGFLPTPVKGGTIKDRQFGSTDTVIIKGHFRGGTAKGKIRVRDKYHGSRCDSHWIHFKAHH